jgi:nucleoid-associated protein YgaU
MGMTSAAEAKLDARIRPDITILRSRTSYPRRHRPALAVLPGGADLPAAAESGRPPRTSQAGQKVAAVLRPDAGEAARATRTAAEPPPIRLTRRGRIVIGVLVAVAVAGVAALIWLAVAGRAQAAGHVRQGTPAVHSMLRVVVRPGDTLWSIAANADPTADPRLIIQQIVDDNALRGTAISAGQVLWVPRI